MSDISPKAISIEYYSFVEGFTQSDYEDDKILGKFYTDYKVARTMIKSLCGQMSGAPVNQRLSLYGFILRIYNTITVAFEFS